MSAQKGITPLPWSVGERPGDDLNPASISSSSYDGIRTAIAMCPRYGKEEHGGNWEIDAAYIVRACNAYPKLVEALENLIDTAVTTADTCPICEADVSKHADDCPVTYAMAALAAAKGE